MIRSVLIFQYRAIRRNPVTFVLIVATALIALYVGYRHGSLKRAIVYLPVLWVCSLFTDAWALRHPALHDLPVRNPQRETAWFLICSCLGVLFLYIRFMSAVPWTHLSLAARLVTIPLIIFVFPVALAIIMLLLRYKPADLGVRLQGFMIVIPVTIVLAITNQVISPESLTWNTVMTESGGITGALFSGLISAGLSEEFFRVVGQTRLGALLHNKGFGWFITTLIWALMHAPKWYGEDHNMTEALLGAMRIVPLGLMWGYITHRTSSILPATLIHGTNFWGLQNF